MNELIHLGQGEQKLRPIIKFKTYNRGLFQIYKTGSYLMRGLLLIIIIILFSGPTCNNNNNNNNNNIKLWKLWNSFHQEKQKPRSKF